MRAPADELVISFVDVAREQRRAERVRAGHDHRRDVADVRRETSGRKGADELPRRDENLAAEVPALLLRGELILEVDAGGARLDHRPHELECVQGAAEARLGIGDDRREPVAPVPLPSACSIWSARMRAWFSRRTRAGALFDG